MEITIQYFGMLAEAIGTNLEKIIITEPYTSIQLKDTLFEKYSLLKSLDFNIAINQQLITDTTNIPEKAEIALLPPFAGG